MMTTVYVGEEAPEGFRASIFLAGPTPRSKSVPSWRPEALRLLEEKAYDGVVFIPERRGEVFDGKWDYVDQVEWEERYLNMSDCILFWIPRNKDTMLGLTTNTEWGKFENSGRVVLGTPDGATQVRYQEYYAQKFFVPIAHTLSETIQLAMNMVGIGEPRIQGERNIPLHIWKTPMFHQWYAAQRAVGNYLIEATVRWLFRTGPNKAYTFMWILHVNIFVASENRHKKNEFIIARPDISTIVMYHRRPDIMDSEIILVREFRSPVSNETGFVWEAPGGSSFKGKVDPKNLAADECHEEAGIVVDPSRIVQHEARQLAATLSTHRSHLFSVEITEEEVEAARKDKGKPHGIIADSEITFTEVVTLRDIMQGSFVDWSMVGMIFRVLSGE